MSGSYNAGSIEASLKLDRSEFNRELRQAKKDAEDFEKKTYSPKVDLDTTAAKAKIRELQTQLSALQNFTIDVALSGYDQVAAQLAALQAQADHLNSTAIVIPVRVDDSAAQASLAALTAAVADLNAQTVTITPDVDTTQADARIAALRASLRSLNDDISRIVIPGGGGGGGGPVIVPAGGGGGGGDGRVTPVVVPGGGDGGGGGGGNPGQRRDPRTGRFTRGTPGPLVPDLGSGDGDGDGDTSTRVLRRLSGGPNLGALFSLPGLIASVLPQIPALTTVIAGATAAVASFGVAALGSFALYGMATFGAVKQALGHQAAVKSTGEALKEAQNRLAQTTAGTDAYKAALQAVTAAEKAHKKALAELTPAEKEFGKSLDGTKEAWKTFIGATQQYTLKPVSTVLDGVKGALPQLVPLIRDLAPAFQEVAVAMRNWLSGNGLQRFVTFLRTTGVPVVKNTMSAFRGLLGAGGSLIRGFGPIAVQMSEHFDNMGARAKAWADNGGVLRFRDNYIKAWHQVRPVLSELGTLLGHVWDILSGTGQPNANALVEILHGLNTALENVKPAAIKAFGEIFQAIADTAIALAPVIGITSRAIVEIVNALPAGTIQAIATAMIAWKLAILGWNAAFMVWGVITALISAFEIAWIALNIVFAASPIGFIITAIVALVAIIVLIALKTNWFQTAWKYTWNAIKAMALWVWGYIGPVFMWIGNAWWTVAKTMFMVYSTVIKVVWNALAASALWLWNVVLKPTFNFIWTAWSTMAKITWMIWSTVFKVVFILFEAYVKFLWVYVLKPIFGFIADAWDFMGRGVMWVWKNVIKASWDGLVIGAQWMWAHGVKPVINFFKAGWDALGNGIKWVYNHIIKPVWDGIASAANSLWKNYISPIFTGIANTISSKWSWIKKNVFSPMGTFFTQTIPGWGTSMKNQLIKAFDLAWKGIKAVWENVKKAIGSPIYLVAKYVWNEAIYGIMDKIAGFVNQKNPLGKIATDKIPHFATGGPVPMTPGARRGKDSVNAMLMPDEHVLTTSDVAAMGGHQAVMRFRSALHNGKAVQGANNTGLFEDGGFLGNITSSVKDSLSKGVSALEDTVLGAVGTVANPLLDSAKGLIDDLVPRSSGWNGLANSTMKKPIDWVKAFINKEDKKMQFSARSVGGVIPTGQHLAIINAALKAAGVPPPGTMGQWQAGLNTLITRESGWNASAINNWDSNAKAGHPSQGLAQTIPSTFNAYVPASLRGRGILDPIANVAAAIRYIVSRYGSITGVQQAQSGKTPRGYWTGTDGAAPGLAWVGEKGPELINFHGGETVYNNSDSMRMAGAIGNVPGYASGTASQRSKVRAAFNERDKDVNRRDDWQRKYNAARAQYAAADTVAEQKLAKKRMAAYDKQVDKYNKEISNDNKLIQLNRKRYKSASAYVEQERKDAAALAAARKRTISSQIASQLNTARNFVATRKAAIDAQIATATEARNGYRDTAVQSGQLSGLTGNRASGFAQQIQQKIKGIQNFQTNLRTLSKLGLSTALIQQIAAMGPEQGGALAQSLARTTTALDAKNLNSQYTALQKASETYADSAAQDGFGLSSLKEQSRVLGSTKITVTAPNTILVNIDGKTFKAHTEKVVEQTVTKIVAEAGKKK